MFYLQNNNIKMSNQEPSYVPPKPNTMKKVKRDKLNYKNGEHNVSKTLMQ